MKVLFIGGTGIISSAVSQLAVERGIELFLLNRGQRQQFVPEGAQVIAADMRDTASVREALKEHVFDTVVNWIVFTEEQIQRDIELFQGRTGQYVFISSASAYQKPPTHYILDESTPLANPYWQYSRDKIACELRLMEAYRESGFPVTIVRPSLTYGSTMIPAAMNSWSKPWSIVERMRAGKPIIVHGDGTSLWTMTHNTDFAKGFIGLLGNPQTLGHAFHITSDEVLSWNQIYMAIGSAAGVEPRLIHIPSDDIVSIYPEEEGNLHGDKAVSAVFDNSKIKRFVPGFHATVSFAEGVKRSVAWFEAHPEQCVIDEAWNGRMDHMLKLRGM